MNFRLAGVIRAGKLFSQVIPSQAGSFPVGCRLESAMSENRRKRRVVPSTILVVLAACLLLSAGKLTNAQSSAPVRRKSVPVGSERPIRLEVLLVLVNLSAVDSKDRIITGLRKEDFAISEDGQPRRLSSFSIEDAPISIGLVFDNSGSMRNKIDSARMSVREFLRTANPTDEFCLIAFSERPSIISDFTQDTSDVITRLNSVGAYGRTALLDAVYLGLSEMRRAKYTRKALLIFSDGGDNHSRYTDKDIKRAVQESDVQIYAMDIHGPIQKICQSLACPYEKSYWVRSCWRNSQE